MAIALGPPVVLPPRGRGPGPRQVAMSMRHRRVDPVADADDMEIPGPDALEAIALRLAVRAPSWPGMARPVRRHWDLMVASDAFEAWVIAWPPGGAIELHDHGGSSGAVVVAAGELIETSLVSPPVGDRALQTNAIGVGRSICFGGRHIHDIVNSGDGPAISVHVYAPRLRSMTYYRMTEHRLEARATVRYRFGQAVA